MDVQLILRGIEDAKDLVASVMEELKREKNRANARYEREVKLSSIACTPNLLPKACRRPPKNSPSTSEATINAPAKCRWQGSCRRDSLASVPFHSRSH